MEYSTSNIEKHCADKGLFFHQAMAEDFAILAGEVGLSQANFDRLATYHIDIMAWAFNPKTYSLGQRLAIAAMFLFGIKIGGK